MGWMWPCPQENRVNQSAFVLACFHVSYSSPGASPHTVSASRRLSEAHFERERAEKGRAQAEVCRPPAPIPAGPPSSQMSPWALLVSAPKGRGPVLLTLSLFLRNTLPK